MSNQLPNLLVGQDLLPHRRLMSEQACGCITFDGSEDERKTLHGDSPVWNDFPVRFYVIPWDRAFDDQGVPAEQTKNMDVILFGMDAIAAFQRSLMERIEAVRVWDKMIVIEGIRNVPAGEMGAFISQCLRRTEHLHMNRRQLVLWDEEDPEAALNQITACIRAGEEKKAVVHPRPGQRTGGAGTIEISPEELQSSCAMGDFMDWDACPKDGEAGPESPFAKIVIDWPGPCSQTASSLSTPRTGTTSCMTSCPPPTPSFV